MDGRRAARSPLRTLVRLLLPRAFDERWGDEIAGTAADRYRDARRAGPASLAAFVGRETLALLTLAVRARGLPTPDPRRPVMYFEPEDTRPLRVAWVIALVVHLLAFMVVFPFEGRSLVAEAEPELTRIKKWVPPPPPDPVERPVEKRRSRPVPIPDPTPDAPEPLASEADIEWVEPSETAEPDFVLAPPPGPPPGPPVDQVYRPGPHIERPELIDRVEPEYPELARRARLQCTVILEAHIGRAGEVLDVKVLRGCGLGLEDSAMRAVRQWRYAPTLVDGRPVEIALTVTVVFQLK